MGQKKSLTLPRVVLDTNCLVSTLLFAHGQLGWLRVAWQSARYIPLVSQAIVKELLQVLAYPKFRLDVNEQESLLAEFLPYAETVSHRTNLSIKLPVLSDPDDMKFLELAVIAKANVLVSGDSDIHAVKEIFSHASIMTPAEFSVWLESS